MTSPTTRAGNAPALPSYAASTATTSARERWFLPRLTLATAYGEGLDGYDLGGISVAIPVIIVQYTSPRSGSG